MKRSISQPEGGLNFGEKRLPEIIPGGTGDAAIWRRSERESQSNSSHAAAREQTRGRIQGARTV